MTPLIRSISPDLELAAVLALAALAVVGWWPRRRDKSCLSLRTRIVGRWRLARLRRALPDVYETGAWRDYEPAAGVNPWFHTL